jgi:apolipoprotein N-acyltransferase
LKFLFKFILIIGILFQMKEIRPYLVIFSAVLSILSFPPFPFGPLILISLVPLFLSIEDISPKKAFKYGYLWGLVFHLGLLYYIGWVTVPGMLATVLILALIPAAASWLYVRLLSINRTLAILSIPSFFLSWNWLLTKSDFNYPWADFGYALSYFRPLIQAADLGGVYLISLFILAIDLLIYVSISEKFTFKPWAKLNFRFIAIVIILAFFTYGRIRLSNADHDIPDKTITVGLIQGNVGVDVKWSPSSLQYSFDKYYEISRQAVKDGAQLLIWPETAIPTYLPQEPQNMAQIRAFVDSINVPVLTGTVSYEMLGPRDYNAFNSAILLIPHKQDFQIYSKIHLVPMSEKIPYSETFRKLQKLELGQANFSSGREQTIFKDDGAIFGTLICFESVFPGYANNFVKKGAEFLVVITNDMWFGRTSLFEQHAMMAVFRAIENRVPVVRAANTGISMAIDKWGKIQARTGVFKDDYIVINIHPERSVSAYNKIGDIIPQCALVIVIISLVIALSKRKNNTERRYVE